MRAGAQPQVVAELPVVPVMEAAVAGARVGRDLVAGEPGLCGALGDAVQHRVGGVLVGHHGRELGEIGVGLEREVIDRQVRRIEAERDVEVPVQIGQRLPGQRIHQVEVEGLEVARGLVERGARLVGAVDTAQAFKETVVEALHAHAQARDAGLAESLEAILLEGAGIGLERDLGVGFEAQQRTDVGQQAVDRVRREQARRAAADEDAVHAAAPDQRQAGLEVGAQRIEVALLGEVALRRLVRIEVAVGAFPQAPGQVDVERERRQGRQLQLARAVQLDDGLAHATMSGYQRSRISASIARAARPRWLLAFLTSLDSWAKV